VGKIFIKFLSFFQLSIQIVYKMELHSSWDDFMYKIYVYFTFICQMQDYKCSVKKRQRFVVNFFSVNQGISIMVTAENFLLQ